MKIYTKIVLDSNGKIIEENSYEYSGPLAECKKGSGGEAAARVQAEKSFQLQKDMFEHQKQQALKLEQGEESEEAKAAAIKQRGIEVNRQGRSSTLHTVKAKQGFSALQAKNPLNIPDELREPIKIPDEKRGDFITRDEKGGISNRVRDALLNKAEIEAANKAEKERLVKIKELQTAHNLKLRSQLDRIVPFARRSLGQPNIKRKKLNAGNT